MEVASILSSPRRKKREINIDSLNKENGSETIVFPGKVLSMGEIDKKLKISALHFSEKAKEKLNKAGCQVSYIADEIKKNPDAKGVKILR